MDRECLLEEQTVLIEDGTVSGVVVFPSSGDRNQEEIEELRRKMKTRKQALEYFRKAETVRNSPIPGPAPKEFEPEPVNR